MSFEVGLMSLGDLLPNPLTGERISEAERHRQIVDQAVQAERLGFTSVHLGEHHFSDYQLSAPPVVLAAIGERTSSLRLSTAVTLAGNLDPVRVAEDYATVDVLSGGRVELVLGRGSLFVKTYEGFGHPVETARERYDEHVALLHRLLNEEDVTWSGEFRPPLRHHTTRPRPVGELPVWIGAASRGSAELAADLGWWLMLPSVFGRPEMFAPIVDVYRARWEANGREWADARVGACSHAHVGATSQQARSTFEPHYRSYWNWVGGLLDGAGMWPDFDLDELIAGPGICGSPAEVIDRIGHWRGVFGHDRHLFMFDLGGIDDTALTTTLERFGTEVLPPDRTRVTVARLEAKWQAFAAIALTYITIVFSSSMAFLVLSSISDDFDVTLGIVAWVVIIEALIVGALLLPLGDLGDRLGRRRVLATGMTIFGVGCVLSGLAPSFGWLIVARIVTSIGNALTQSIATGLMVASFPREERGLAMGAQTTAVAMGSASGPVFTGLLLQVLSWRTIFVLLAIPSAAAVATVLTLIERDEPRPKGGRSIDIGSAALSAMAVTLMTVTINNPFDWSWGSWPIIVGGLLTVATFVAYVRWELASDHPMLDLRLFRIVAFRTGVNVRWLGFLASTTLMLLMPVLLISVQGRSGGLAGLVISCTAIGMGISAQVSGRLYDRVGPKPPSVVGLTLQAAVFAGLTFVDQSTHWSLLALASLLQGTAMGQWNVAGNSAMLGATPPESLGVGGAFTNVTRTVGNVFGQAIATAIVVAILREQGFDIPLGDLEDTPGAGGAFIDGFRAACAMGAVISLGLALFAARSSWDRSAGGVRSGPAAAPASTGSGG